MENIRSTIELTFLNLPNFRVLFDGVVPPHNISFNLKRLVLWQCPKMENIFSALLLHNFPNLEELQVQDCKNVEEIIVKVETSDRGGHREDDGDTITLPNLKILFLHNLPRLESIYKGIMVCESLQQILISNCPMLRRLPISLHMNEDGEQATAPPALRMISGAEEWWESLEWDNPLTKTTLQPFYSSRHYLAAEAVVVAAAVQQLLLQQELLPRQPPLLQQLPLQPSPLQQQLQQQLQRLLLQERLLLQQRRRLLQQRRRLLQQRRLLQHRPAAAAAAAEEEEKETEPLELRRRRRD